MLALLRALWYQEAEDILFGLGIKLLSLVVNQGVFFVSILISPIMSLFTIDIGLV